MLARSGDVLHPIREEIIGVLPHLGSGSGRIVTDLGGGFNVRQVLERESGAEDVVQHPSETGAVARLADRVTDEGRESGPVQGPGLEKIDGLGLQAVAGDQRLEDGVAQLAEQRLVPAASSCRRETRRHRNRRDQREGAKPGVIMAVQSFGAGLKTHVHYHILITDGIQSGRRSIG